MWLMITAPYNKIPKKLWKMWLNEFDIKNGIFAIERGKNGYHHWQIRLRVSDSNSDTLFNRISKLGGHVEKQSSADNAYERKDGLFWVLSEPTEVRKVRFGMGNRWQKHIIHSIKSQSVREILVVVGHGNEGKSWLVNHLYERYGQLYISPLSKNPAKDVASQWNGQKLIVIDMPRTCKWSDNLYIGMEQIKDGLVVDERYNYTVKNIRGTKLLVISNHMPKLDKLTADRWNVINLDDIGEFLP